MKLLQFDKLVKTITNLDISILDNNVNPNDDILMDSEYFIRVKGNGIIGNGFVFKTPKNIDNLVKTFITQLISKLKIQRPEFAGKSMYNLSHHCLSSNEIKDMIMFSINNNIYSYCKYALYPTQTYGIGISTFLLNSNIESGIENLFAFLKDNNIPYKTEFSKKNYVFRVKISNDIDVNKYILNKCFN